MKYTILSIDNSRESYKERIRDRIQIPEVFVKAVNGNTEDAVEQLRSEGILLRRELWTPKKGEAGIWASIVNCWKWCIENDEELVVFEDDAIPVQNFQGLFNDFHDKLPVDYDFAALWVPNNQRDDYFYFVSYDENGVPHHVSRPPGMDRHISIYAIDGAFPVSEVYQGYGGVAMLFSPNGARKFMEISRKMGVYTPIDCHFYLSAHRPVDNVFGYAPHPEYMMVDYDWAATTTIHHTERVE